jgi:16S rRNA (cytidine1402-2'-O)-methyltransferase
MGGTLTICGTPIGNLEDISPRALRALSEADIIAAEDTRRTLKLLNYFKLSSPLTSCHEHNETTKGKKLLEELLSGKNVALVSDAGMPCVSDPGAGLVKLCHEKGVRVTSAPGPTALTTAAALSGFSCDKFIFEGFLPQNNRERAETLDELINQRRAVIFYEAPHRLLKTLREIARICGDRRLCVIREITKIHEEILRFTAEEAADYYEKTAPRGEYVIVLEGLGADAFKQARKSQWETMDIDEHVAMYEQRGLDKKNALKAVAKDRGTAKSNIYSHVMKKQE